VFGVFKCNWSKVSLHAIDFFFNIKAAIIRLRIVIKIIIWIIGSWDAQSEVISCIKGRLHLQSLHLWSTELVQLREWVQFRVQWIWFASRIYERVLLNLSLTHDLFAELTRPLIMPTLIEVNKQGSKPMNSYVTLPASKQISFLVCFSYSLRHTVMRHIIVCVISAK